MKQTILKIGFLMALLSPFISKAQNEIDTAYLMQVYNRTSYIFEGEVIDQCTFQDPSDGMIYTDNKVEISATSQDVGEAREEMLVKYEAKPIQVAFNPEFMMAPLRNLETDTVYLDLIDEMSPGVIRIDGSFLYVLMPMRVTS